MPEEKEKAISSFPEVLRELRGGRTAIELSERLTEVVAAVQATGKAGRVSIELKIIPANKSDQCDQLYVCETVKHTIPEKDKPDTLFMVNHEGILQSFASRQIQMELRDLNDTVGKELREIK